MMATADYDDILGRIRGLLISLGGALSSDESGEVDHLLDHGELGEALRTLAWLIVEEHKRVAPAEVGQMLALAERMGIVDELPSTLAANRVDHP